MSVLGASLHLRTRRLVLVLTVTLCAPWKQNVLDTAWTGPLQSTATGIGSTRLKLPNARRIAQPRLVRHAENDIVEVGNVLATGLNILLGSFVIWFSYTSFNRKTGADEPVVTGKDPGRAAIAAEWKFAIPTEVLRLPLNGGGTLCVTACDATQRDTPLPADADPDSLEEWRLLRFEPEQGSLATRGSDLIQAVNKIYMSDEDDLGRMRADCLPMFYSKSLVAVSVTALCALGAPVLPTASSKDGLRILCIGLGGGSAATFLHALLPNCRVDIAELEPAVLQAASEGMGFVQSPGLQVAIEDGVDFAKRALADATGKGGVYDAILIDANDSAGNVPESLRTQGAGGITDVLAKGLLRASGGIVATNFLSHVDVAEPVNAYYNALLARGAGVGFSVNVPGDLNKIAVQTASSSSALASAESLQDELKQAATKVQSALPLPFDFEYLALRGLEILTKPALVTELPQRRS